MRVIPVVLITLILLLFPKLSPPPSPLIIDLIVCNVILKIITKAIANRVKKVLPLIISEHQSTFLSNRLITDNILIAFEAFHKLHMSKNFKKGFVGIKIDMAKAYDRIEWSFLNNTLITMGFPINLVNTIMRCVSTVSFSILINGQPSNDFTPHRGLRQGDPLSPYLFIICAEVLSGLIAKGQADGHIHGIQITNTALAISHLFFC